MIIHIGDNNYVFEKDIIAILDKKTVDATKKSRDYINKLIEDNCLIGSLGSSIKSYIIVSDSDKTKVYTSRISSKALTNRSIY